MSSNTGVKGSDIHTHDEVGDSRVVLAALLVRGADPTMIKTKLNTVLEDGHLTDAFVLAFMNRNIRGGKGERDLFYTMFSHLHAKQPALAEELLDLVPHFGYWGDVFTLVEKDETLKNRALILTTQKLVEDEGLMTVKKSPSLLAKWIPREGKPLAKELATLLSKKPQIQARLADYRKRISALNKYLQTTEIAMCADHWANIVPERVPGRCLKLHTKAFLNESLKGRGLRKPDDAGRMDCREHFQRYFAEVAKGKKVAKGADTLYPHEIIRAVTKCQMDGSHDARNALIGAWNAFIVKAKESGGLGRSIPMCDFSGSMSHGGAHGVSPLEVSRALGLLISEVTTDAFKGKMLTFDSTPELVSLPEEGDIFHKVEWLNRHSHYGQGLSTDFQKAMELVLDTLVKHRVPVGQEPENLIVLTDMAWDAAFGSNETSYYTSNRYRRNAKTAPWQTHIQMIRENFKRVGEDMWGEGKGYTVPRIVIWNIANSCDDMHATADTEGVVMLSGWSSAMFKVLMAKGVEITTPYKALRYQLDDEMYDVVRERIAKFLEKKD
jgi:hypothetical protein